MKKSQFQLASEQYKRFRKNGFENDVIEKTKAISRINIVKQPMLQAPAMTPTDTLSNVLKHGFKNSYLGIDYTTVGFHIIQQLFEKNNHVRLATHIVASLCTNCSPFFLLETDKKTRDTTLITKLTKTLNNPNSYEGWYPLVYKTYASLHSTGNAYWQVIYKKNGDIHSIYQVPPQTIRPIPYIDKETGLLEYAYVQLKHGANNNLEVNRVFSNKEIIHFKDYNPFSDVFGLSTYAPLFANLEFDNETKVYLNKFMENSFSGGMIFEIKEAHPDVVERNREELEECLIGAENAGRNMILEGDIRVVHDGNKSKDFPLETIYTSNKDEIFTSAKVPLSMAGIRTDKGVINAELIEQEEQSMRRNTIEHYQEIFFSTLNRRLISANLNNDTTTISAGVNRSFSLKNAENIVKTGLQIGGKINDFNKILGMPADPEEGETYIVGTNNGIIKREDYFNSVAIDSQMKEVQLEQEKKNLEAEPEDSNTTTNNSNTTGTNLEDLSQPPSVKVSTGKGETKVEK